MSYYSDVKLITTKKGWEQLRQAVKQADPDADLMDYPRTLTTQEKQEYLLGEWNDRKWYDWDFADLKAFMHELGLLDEPYDFMRIGEDYEDVEHLYHDTRDYPHYMPKLWLEREIKVEGV